MATSSIFTEFSISTEKEADQFAKALEKSEKQTENKMTESSPISEITDLQKIKKFFEVTA